MLNVPPFMRSVLMICSAAAILVTACIACARPSWNWDMLPYMAAAARLDGSDPVSAHAQAYAAAQCIPAEAYQQLIDPNNTYRATLHTDAIAFADQDPFYWVKPLYIALIWAFWKLGIPLAWATLAPSLVSFLVLGHALTMSLRSVMPLHFAWPCSALFLALPCVNELAGLSTPDALSTALIIVGLFLVHGTARPGLGAAVLVLSIAARADNLILVGLVLLTQRLCKPERPLPAWGIALACASAAATYGLVDSLACAQGWCLRPIHAFLPRSLHPQREPVRSAWEMYRETFQRSGPLFRFTWIREFALLVAATFLLALWRGVLTGIAGPARVLVVITAAMLIRFAFFPVPDDRSMVVWYASAWVFTAAVIIAIARARTGIPHHS